MSGFAEKLNVRNYVNSTKNCVHYTFEMSGFEEKLIVQSCTNSMGNSVHYKYKMSGFVEKLNVQTVEIQQEIVYIIYVRNGWICRKIDFPEL